MLPKRRYAPRVGVNRVKGMIEMGQGREILPGFPAFRLSGVPAFRAFTAGAAALPGHGYSVPGVR
jgi:hypothetical protein